MGKKEDTKKTIQYLVENLSKKSKIIKSIILVGSYSDATEEEESDVDILILTKGELSVINASILGARILEVEKKINKRLFFFHHPLCERCTFTIREGEKFHILVHSWENINDWLKKREFIICMWANKSTLLWGENPFKDKPKPEFNSSLLNAEDGIPGLLKEIKWVLLTKSEKYNIYEHKKHIKYYENRIQDMIQYFPELLNVKKVQADRNDIRKNLIQIGKYLEKIEKYVRLNIEKK